MNDGAVNELIRQQHGVISRQQAFEQGLSRFQVGYRVRSGTWVQVARGIYRHALWPPSWKARVMTLCLARRAVASHRTAATLHRVDGYRPGRVEVVIDYRLHRPVADAIVHQTTQLDGLDMVVVEGIPTTGLGRTVLDVAAVVSRKRLEATVDAVIRDDRLTYEQLHAVLRQHARRGRDGCGKLREVLDERVGSPTVPLSQWGRDVANLLTDGGLPGPELEYRAHRPDGSFLAQLDLAYPDVKVGIELDSVRYHLNRESFERDPARRNRLEVEGWSILNFTWRFTTEEPEALCLLVHQARTTAITRNLGSQG